MPDQFDRFTRQARKALELAQEEAHRLNHNYIGTEHLLLGLLCEGEGVAARALAELGVELDRVRAALEFVIGRGDRTVTGDIGLTPRAKKVLQFSIEEARLLGHRHIGTEHLLLGLVREAGGVGAGFLESLGASLDQVRSQVIYVLNQSATKTGEQVPPTLAPTKCVETLVAASNETDTARRHALVEQVWAHSGIFTNVDRELFGVDEIQFYLGFLQRRLPGCRFMITSPIQTLHDYLRYTWRYVGLQGSVAEEGVDIVERARDGRIRRLIRFVGLTPGPSETPPGDR